MPAERQPPAAATDGETIAASLREPARFAGVFDRHYDEIAHYLARRVDPGLAEELASETFLRAFAARAAYDLGYPDARPWLYGIATNLLRRHARSEHRRRHAYARALEREDVPALVEEGVADRLDAARGARAVADALGRMTPADRDTLLLFALAGLDYEGIAIATGVPVGTVRSRLHRVRHQLQAVLAGGDELAFAKRSHT